MRRGETMNDDMPSLIDMLDLKRGNTQGGNIEPLKKEDSDRNSDDFISIVDRLLPDSHGDDILSPLKDLSFLIQLNIPPYFPSLNLAC